MRENNENFRGESDTAFALASFLLNLLILLVLCGTLWAMYSLVTQSNSIGLLLSEIAGGR